MAAIILEEDPHSLQATSFLLGRLGYHPILRARSLDEAAFLFQGHGRDIQLILSSESSNLGHDLPIARLVSQERELDLAPLILATNFSLPRKLTAFRGRPSRVDHIQTKPFGRHGLERGIELAFQRRAELRSRILFFGPHHENAISELAYEGGKKFHWKKAAFAFERSELVAAINRSDYQLGAICVQSSALTTGVARFLKKFKRSPLGLVTPICMIGKESERLHLLNAHVDLVFEETAEVKMLTVLSRRLRFQHEMKAHLVAIRTSIKGGDFQSATRHLREAFLVDPDRWELEELQGLLAVKTGRPEEAISSFEKTIETQPFSAFAHIQLLRLTQNRPSTFERARHYFPRLAGIQDYGRE